MKQLNKSSESVNENPSSSDVEDLLLSGSEEGEDQGEAEEKQGKESEKGKRNYLAANFFQILKR